VKRAQKAKSAIKVEKRKSQEAKRAKKKDKEKKHH